jgi:colanic acid biosynthesis glycosyl transferase WcaI
MLKNTELFKTVIPTKLLEYMACERPVIVAVDGQARKIVEEAEAGVFVPPENSQALVDAIVELAAHPERRLEMGRGGRKHILQHFSRESKSSDYIGILSALVQKERPLQ